MPFIEAKNGNVVEFDDENLGRRALADGHGVFETDPRTKGKKPKVWSPDEDADTDGDAAAGSDSE